MLASFGNCAILNNQTIQSNKMRQLKFRAWDTKNNNWLNPSDTNDGVGITFNGQVAFCSQSQFGYVAEEDKNRFVIQQSTGTQDFNDTDIYEGDIIFIENVKELYKGYRYSNHAHVWYSEFRQAYVVSFNHMYSECSDELGKIYAQIKVVGNIFQNPELLQN